MSEEFDFENIKIKDIEQLKAGKPLLDKVTLPLSHSSSRRGKPFLQKVLPTIQ